MKFEPVYTKKTFPELWAKSSKIADIQKLEKYELSKSAVDILALLDSDAFISGSSALHLLETKAPKRPFNDVDVYFTGTKSYKNTLAKLEKSGFTKKSETSYQLQMSKEGFPHIISLIKMMFYDSMIHCLDTFDFTVAQVAFNNKECYANKFALEDELKNALCIHKIQPQTDWLARLVKYIKKGYEPTAQCLHEIEEFYLKKKDSNPSTTRTALTSGVLDRYDRARSSYQRLPEAGTTTPEASPSTAPAESVSVVSPYGQILRTALDTWYSNTTNVDIDNDF